MSHFQFPLSLTFKIGTFANDFIATDANDQTLAYVRQKMFKLKEEVNLFTDDSKSELKYSIKANKWLDFSASYLFEDANGKNLGRVVGVRFGRRITMFIIRQMSKILLSKKQMRG